MFLFFNEASNAWCIGLELFDSFGQSGGIVFDPSTVLAMVEDTVCNFFGWLSTIRAFFFFFFSFFINHKL
jgi:hypothetical protein